MRFLFLDRECANRFFAFVFKVMSVTLDDWSSEQVDFMEAIGGNASANSVYENFVPSDTRKPPPDASVEERTDYIRCTPYTSYALIPLDVGSSERVQFSFLHFKTVCCVIEAFETQVLKFYPICAGGSTRIKSL